MKTRIVEDLDDLLMFMEEQQKLFPIFSNGSLFNQEKQFNSKFAMTPESVKKQIEKLDGKSGPVFFVVVTGYKEGENTDPHVHFSLESTTFSKSKQNIEPKTVKTIV